MLALPSRSRCAPVGGRGPPEGLRLARPGIKPPAAPPASSERLPAVPGPGSRHGRAAHGPAPIAGRRRDGRPDIGSGPRHRIVQRHPLRQARRRSPRPGCSRCHGYAGLDPRASKRRCRPRRQQIDHQSPVRCPPFSSTAGTPSVSSAAAARCISASSRIGMPDSTSASGRFGVMRAASGSRRRFRVSTASVAAARWPPLATITGSTHQRHAGACAPTRRTTASMVGRRAACRS